MTNNPTFNNNATNEEKAEYLRNEKRLRKGDRQASTLFGQAIIDMKLDAGGGRYVEKTGLDVVGTKSAAQQYPRQDSASPWSGGGAHPGLEPPTGQDINFVEPCGEQFEIERSIAEQSIGEPEPRCDHTSRVPNQRLQSGVEGLGSPPPVDRGAPADQSNSAVPSTGDTSALCEPPRSTPSSTKLAGEQRSTPAVVGSAGGPHRPLASRRSPANPSSHPDGLDVPRRADGMPLSSHAVKKPRRRI